MSFLTGKSQAAQATAVSGLQLQSSAYGKVVPIVYGTTRIAPNLIWYGDFVATPQASSAGGAGKGGGGGSGGKGGSGGSYVYQTAVALGLCEGPMRGVGSVYLDKSTTTLSALGLSFFSGAYGQAPWAFLASQATPVTEARVIPASAPYTITVGMASDFLSDAGVTQSASGSYHKVSATPSSLQYNVSVQSGKATYVFSSANAGSNITIRCGTLGGVIQTVNAVIPSSAPFSVSVTLGSSSNFVDDGVVGTGAVYVVTGSAPATHQYNVANGTYTFSAVNAGATVTIVYYTASGNPALGYSGITYAAASAYQLGTSAQLPNHNFEVYGNAGFITGNGLDADPGLIVTDLLSNPHYGCGFPASRIGSLSIYQAYCIANGLWISPAYTDQSQTSSMLTDIATATNSDFVWSGGVLTLVPYGDANASGNGYAYTAPVSPLYDLTDDDFMANVNVTGATASINDDAVLLTRVRSSDAINQLQIEVLDRANLYNTAIITASDQAMIETYGLRSSQSTQMHMFCDLNAARVSAQLQLQRQAIRNTYQFTLDQRYVLLDPMDIVTITDAALGLNRQWVRITEMTENDDGSLSISAEEYLDGTGNAPLYSFQAGQGFSGNYNVDPGDANAPVIFEPTAELAESLEVWLAASGGPLWGGCDVYISNDGDSYRNVGRITGAARTGVLTAPLAFVAEAPTGATIDTSNTLSVDLSQSDGQLLSGSQNDALSLATLCYVDGEYIAYENALLTGSDAYALSWLVRGAYGTTPSSHLAGAPFARLDNSIFSFTYTQDFIGTTIYIKLVSFNIYGGGQQLISDVSPYAYTLTGLAFSSAMPDVTNLTSSYVANITQLSWTEITDFRAVLYEIRKGSAWTGAQVLGRVAHSPFAVQGDGTYWVGVFSQPLPGLQVYSANPPDIIIAGAQITSNVIASYDEAATGWTGTVSGDAIATSGFVRTGGSGNILLLADYLDTPDLLNYGGVGNGIYQIPVSHVVNIGRVAPCSVIISWSSVAQHISDNILNVLDYLSFPDLLDFSASGNTDVYPEISLSQDGTTWEPWQKYAPGSYSAMAFTGRMQLQTLDPTIEAILQGFVFSVDVPDRDDHYVNLSIPSGGLNLTFRPDGASSTAPFNGGPAGSPLAPHVQVTILSAQSGDIASITSVTLSGCTIKILNGGSGVARSVNVLVQGY